MNKLIQRPWNASADINRLEHQWWQDNADLISRVWEMERSISLLIRGNYLSKAKNFICSDGPRNKILELGCGSGWVGQFIAGDDLTVIGTDFSDKQIELARKNAERLNVSQWCHYFVQDDKEIPAQISECTAVLIHCFLHHLDGQEIEDLLRRLSDKARPGTKFYFHEPAFYASPPVVSVVENPASAVYHEMATALHANVQKSLRSNGLVDQEFVSRFETVANIAEANNWYLSPKEVPFDVVDFTAQLGKHFAVRNQYWSNIYAIGWGFDFTLINQAMINKVMNEGVLQILIAVDNILAQDLGFLQRMMKPPAYAFHVWECVKH